MRILYFCPSVFVGIHKSQVFVREDAQERPSSGKEKSLIAAWKNYGLFSYLFFGTETLLLEIMYLPEISNVIFRL